MKLSDRLVLGRLLPRTAVIFLFAAVVGMTTQLLGEIFRLVEAAGGLALAWQFFSFVFPMITVSLLPFAFLVAMLITYGSMEQDRESTVLLASGMRPLTLLRPSIWLAVAISALVLVFSLFFEPPANRALRAMLDGLHHDPLRLIVADGTLRELAPGLYAHARGTGPDGEITGLMVIDRRNSDEQLLLLAGSGVISRGESRMQLRLEQGIMLLHDPAHDGAHSLRFGRFIGDPSEFLPPDPPAWGPIQATTPELVSMVRAARAEGRAHGQARAELLRRLTDWLWPLVFLAIGAWAIAGTDRSFRRWRLFGAAVIAALGRIGGVVMINASVGLPAAVHGAVALPIGLAAVFFALARLRGTRSAARHPVSPPAGRR